MFNTGYRPENPNGHREFVTLSESHGDRYRQARENLEQRDHLRGERVRNQDSLTQEEYHLRRLQVALEAVEDDIDTLQRPTLTGLMHALFGGKEVKIREMQNEQAAIQTEFHDVERTLDSLYARAQQLEQELGGLSDVEQEFEDALATREQAILAGDDERAKKLAEVAGYAEWASEQSRTAKRALEAAENVAKRLQTMSRALSRARKNQIFVRGAPMVAAGWNTLKAHGAKGHVSNVRDGLRRLHERLTDMDTGSDAHHDLEINRYVPVIEHLYSEELTKGWEQWAVHFADSGHPIERDVVDLIGHIEEKVEQSKRALDSYTKERKRLIADD